MKKYRHIVLFRLRDNISASAQKDIAVKLRNLGDNHRGIESWKINTSLDTRKGIIIIEEAIFTDKKAFENFRKSPQHLEVVEIMKEIADWWAGDYLA